MAITTYLSIITLNVNWLKYIGWLNGLKNNKKTRLIYILLRKTHFRSKDTQRIKIKG